MEHKIIKKALFFLFTLAIIGTSSCYKDNAELLQIATACDTSNITFALGIAPIIQTNCQGCHSGGAPAGNIALSNYTEIKASVTSGRLMGTIRHEAGFSAMPKGGNKISDCDIKKLEIWIAKGTPNN